MCTHFFICATPRKSGERRRRGKEEKRRRTRNTKLPPMSATSVITARGAAGRSAVDADALTLAAIKQRDSVHRNYRAIVNPVNGLPMLQLNRHECEVMDPRACIHHYDSAADLACAIYIHVSLPYFYALVQADYIANKTRVVLHDTDFESYVFVLAQNEESTAPSSKDTVEQMLNGFRKCNSQASVRQAGPVKNTRSGRRVSLGRRPVRRRLPRGGHSEPAESNLHAEQLLRPQARRGGQ